MPILNLLYPRQCAPPTEQKETVYNIPIHHEQSKPAPAPNQQQQNSFNADQGYQTWPRQPKPQQEPQHQQGNGGNVTSKQPQPPVPAQDFTDSKNINMSAKQGEQQQQGQSQNSGQNGGNQTKSSKPKTPMDVINDILTECQQFKDRVNSFRGTKSDKEYKLLEEMMTRSILKLDGIESGSDTSIRQARKKAVHEIQSYLDQLELAAFSAAAPTPSDASSNRSGSEERSKQSDTKNDKNVKEMVLDSEINC